MSDTEKSLAASSASHIEVQKKELPLACPTPRMTLWNMHPKVVLQINEIGQETSCPYCGTRYIVVGDQ